MWIFFRILWGLSFSAMRIGTLGYALQHERHGLAFGVTRSLHEFGPMLSLFLAPLLVRTFEVEIIFFVLAGLSLPSLWFAWKLPKTDDRTQAVKAAGSLKFPSTFNSITLVSAILVEGVLIVVLGILFLEFREHISLVTATTLAAFYLGYRRACLVVFSPAGGWAADKIGLDKVFNISIAFMIIGLFLIVLGWVATGSVIAFTFYSINSAISPGTASKNQGHALSAVAQNATWRDVGTAFGTLAGGFLLTSEHLTTVLLLSNVILVILLLIHVGTAGRAMKFLYLRK
jgi:MFS family permease